MKKAELEVLVENLKEEHKTEIWRLKFEIFKLKKQLKEKKIKTFQDWNESGFDEDIGNSWHIMWTDYIQERGQDKSFWPDFYTEEIPYILENCFNAGFRAGQNQ